MPGRTRLLAASVLLSPPDSANSTGTGAGSAPQLPLKEQAAPPPLPPSVASTVSTQCEYKCDCCGAPDKKHGANRHVLVLGENDDFAPGSAITMAALHPQIPAAQLRCSQYRVATAAPAITAGIMPELRSGVCACCAFCGFFGITVVLRSSSRRRRCSENFRVTFTATLFPGYKHHVVVPSRPDSYIHYMCF